RGPPHLSGQRTPPHVASPPLTSVGVFARYVGSGAPHAPRASRTGARPRGDIDRPRSVAPRSPPPASVTAVAQPPVRLSPPTGGGYLKGAVPSSGSQMLEKTRGFAVFLGVVIVVVATFIATSVVLLLRTRVIGVAARDITENAVPSLEALHDARSSLSTVRLIAESHA